MPLIQSLEDVNKLLGSPETDEIEAKNSLISKKDMVEKILSFMNGEKELGYIILGVSENNAKVMDKVVGVTFPYQPNQPNQSNQVGKIGDFNKYKKSVLSHLKGQIHIAPLDTPKRLDAYLNTIIVFNTFPIDQNNPKKSPVVIVIAVKQSAYRPIFNKESYRYHKRYPESQPGKGDARSDLMQDVEIYTEMLSRHRRIRQLHPGSPPVYHHESEVPDQDLATLFDNIYRGDEVEVFKLINSRPEILMMVDSFGNNALHIAVFYEQTTIIERLITEYKMSIFVTNKIGWTPFTNAVYIGNLALTELFLSKNLFLLKNRDHLGYNAFLISILYDHIDLTKWFITQEEFSFDQIDVSLKIKEINGFFPLSVAVYGKSRKVFDYLLNLLRNQDQALFREHLIQAKNVASTYNHEDFFKDIENILNNPPSSSSSSSSLFFPPQGQASSSSSPFSSSSSFNSPFVFLPSANQNDRENSGESQAKLPSPGNSGSSHDG